MGILDALLGRTRPVKPNLDVLFAIPSAAFTLQAALDLAPTGRGAVCFKNPEGAAATQTTTDILALLSLDPATGVALTDDEYGFTWITCTRPDGDLSALVTDLHAVNATLGDAGFGPSLLCSVVGFTAVDGRRLGLVYLFKRGTVYPFAPVGGQTRDTALEMQVRAQLGADIPVERDLARWFAIWGAPVP